MYLSTHMNVYNVHVYITHNIYKSTWYTNKITPNPNICLETEMYIEREKEIYIYIYTYMCVFICVCAYNANPKNPNISMYVRMCSSI